MISTQGVRLWLLICWIGFGVQGAVAGARGYGEVPPVFEENRGQMDGRASYLLRGGKLDLFVTKTGAVLDLKKGEKRAAVRMEVVGASGDGAAAGEGATGGQSSYFQGNDPAKWVSGARQFSRVRVSDVRRGVDLLWYANRKELEYDLVVKPGARVEDARVRFAGAERVSLTDEGELRIGTAAGELVQHRPRVWQVVGDEKREVAGRYRVSRDGEVSVAVGEYDRSRELVIDPVISYSTYLGGSWDDLALALKVDGSGNAYVTGETSSTNFPTTVGAYQVALGTLEGYSNVFVAKFNSTGTALLYSTYLGGNYTDYGSSIAIDANGNAYVTGHTLSQDFPTTAGAYQTTAAGAFLTKLNPSGTALIYSTYVGDIQTSGNGIQTDAGGNAYLTGSNASPADFPAASGGYGSSLSGVTGGFVLKLNPSGTQPIYWAFLENGNSYGIAVDSSDRAYVTGLANGTNFPTTAGAYQPTLAFGGAFVSEISADGRTLIASTYLGEAEAFDLGEYSNGGAIALDSNGNVYVTGTTGSSPFPTTTGSYLASPPAPLTLGATRIFVTKLNSSLSGLIYSTYLDGSFSDTSSSIAVDSTGHAYIAGYTMSPDFPITTGSLFGSKNPGPEPGYRAAFLTQIDPSGSSLDYSTLLAGTADDAAYGVAVDANLGVYVAGSTSSVDFPITSGAFQTASTKPISEYTDAFVTKLDFSSNVSCSLSISPTSYSAPVGGGSTSFAITTPQQCPWVLYNYTNPNLGTITLTGPTHGFGNATVGITVPQSPGTPLSTSIGVGAETFSITQPAPTCVTPLIAPASAAFSSAGGSGSVAITQNDSCPTYTTPTVPWIHVTSGSPSSDAGGSVTYSVDRNDFGSRSGSLSVGTTVFPVSQTGAGCNATASVVPATASAGGTGYISLTTSSGTCVWYAYSLVPWIQVVSTSGMGSATVGIIVAANPSATARTGQILVAGQTVSMTQAAGPAVTPTGYTISTIAGSGSLLVNGSPATSTALSDPNGLAFDASGNLYLADTENNVVRMVGLDGSISTVAGNGSTTESGDGGAATAAGIYAPVSLAFDSAGNLYIGQPNGTIGQPSGYIREVSGGMIRTFYSGPTVSGQTLAVDSSNNVYFNDSNTGSTIQQVTQGGTVSTFAGSTAQAGFTGDGGPAISALLSNHVYGLVFDSASNLYFADQGNNRVRRISGNTITTVAGTVGFGFNGDGVATATNLNFPNGAAVDGMGNVVVLDQGNKRVRRFTPGGNLTTIAGNGSSYTVGKANGDGGPALSAEFNSLSGIAVDPFGDIAVSDPASGVVRLLTPTYTFCTYSVSTSAIVAPASLSNFNATVTTGAGCVWNTNHDVDWIVFSTYPGGTGSGTFGFTVEPNSTGATRTGTVFIAGQTIAVTQAATAYPSLTIDSPAPNASLSGIVAMSGWAIENTTSVGPYAVQSVTVAVDGTQVGTANYGSARADVCNNYPGRLGCPNVGWTYSLNVSALSTGSHVLKVTAVDTAGNSTPASLNFTTTAPPPPSVIIDAPAANSILAGTVAISGWALENSSVVSPYAIQEVTVFVDGTQVGTATYGSARADVCNNYPGRAGCPNVGWSYSLNVSSLAAGSHVLKIVATDTTGNSNSSQVSFTIAAQYPSLTIDAPGPNATLSGMVAMSGWAIENTSLAGTHAVQSVAVFVDSTQVGTATYGAARPDVCNNYPGRLGCPNVGWTYSLNVNALTAGSHVLKVVATDSAGNSTSSQLNFTSIVAQVLPYVTIDAPAPNASLSGTAAMSGWAIENNTVAGPYAVQAVNVFVDGTQVGTATYGAARMDVCNVYPSRLGCPNVGWTYNLNVNALNAGSHVLKVTATDSAGNSGSSQVNFTAMAAQVLPYVTIDAPAPNATLSGTADLSGWALESNTVAGPYAVQSVNVFVDGTQVGTATYGNARMDVCNVYPARLGCPDVGWTYSLNVNALTSGSHVLKIVATDSAGNSGSSQVNFTATVTEAPSVTIDAPIPNATLSGTATLSGWALENNTVAGPYAVASVAVFVDGTQIGTAIYGAARADVCNVYPSRLGCPNVGWTYSLNVNILTSGSHVLKIVATDSAGNSGSSQVNFTANATNLPSITVDAPAASAALSGMVTASGWAIENDALVGPDAVQSVTVFVDGSQVGTATYGGVRADVCNVYPGRLGCPNVGWSYILNVSPLASGSHTLKFVATDTAGNSASVQNSFTK